MYVVDWSNGHTRYVSLFSCHKLVLVSTVQIDLCILIGVPFLLPSFYSPSTLLLILLPPSPPPLKRGGEERGQCGGRDGGGRRDAHTGAPRGEDHIRT